jgi:hypothetical protein
METNMKTRTTRRKILAATATAVLVAGTASAAWLLRPPLEDLDFSLSRATEAGLYVASIKPAIDPIRIGEMHSWTVTLTEPGGAPVDDARITIDGGMPRHGHGLPTSPEVTRVLGGGSYRIDGMKFNMPGWWTIDLVVDSAKGTDSVTFNLSL